MYVFLCIFFSLPVTQFWILDRASTNTHEQVDNRGSLDNVGTKWIQEINEHCPGVKIVLCALKCDLREEQEKEDDDDDTAANNNTTAADPATSARNMIQYNEGLEVARRIGALRYLGMLRAPASHVGCSAKW